MFARFIGVDVAKAKVDVFVSDTGEVLQVRNDEHSLSRLVRKLDCKDALAVIDLTGGYEAVCVKTFHVAGGKVHRAEGRKVKAFMCATGRLAKTDAIDARALADYGQRLQDRLALYAPDENAVKPYVARLADLKQILRDEKNRRESPSITPEIRGRMSLNNIQMLCSGPFLQMLFLSTI